MRVAVVVAVAGLSACSWFGGKRAPLPPTEFVVTGAPEGSVVFVDGAPSGPANSADGHPQVVDVAPGPHTVEIHSRDRIVYREDTYAAAHQHTLVRVLSGSSRYDQ